MKHLLSVDDLGRPGRGIESMLDLTDSFLEITQRDIPKIPALARQGRFVSALLRGLDADAPLVRGPRRSASPPTR